MAGVKRHREDADDESTASMAERSELSKGSLKPDQPRKRIRTEDLSDLKTNASPKKIDMAEYEPITPVNTQRSQSMKAGSN